MSSKVDLPREKVCDQEFFFFQEQPVVSLEITKSETEELTYQLGVEYLGPNEGNGRQQFLTSINGQDVYYGMSDLFQFQGSTELAFTPCGADVLKVVERDERETSTYWIDLSDSKRYRFSTANLEVDERIQALIAKARVLNPSEGFLAKKIFYHGEAVFVYARLPGGGGEIYGATKEEDEFAKYESKRKSQCRCPTGDSTWEITHPTTNQKHTLVFPQGDVGEGGHGSEHLLDNNPLRVASMRAAN